MKLLFTLSVMMLGWMPLAQAELFKCVGTDGKITYSEAKQAKSQCTPVTTQITVVPAPPRAAAKSSETGGRERETPTDQSKQIAEQERALNEAKKALAEQESIRLGGEQNYQRVLDRLKPYQDKVAEIEKKLAELRDGQSKIK